MSDICKTEVDLYVANSVKAFRLKIGMSQNKLANELDVTHSFIQAIESPAHRAKYNIVHLNKLAEIFNCSPKDFLPDKAIISNKI